jgi:predicted nucleic acid-binding protein
MRGAEAEGGFVVLDASVAVRWTVPEEGGDEAVALLRRPPRWLAPRLLLTEAAGALRRKVTGGQLRAEHAPEALAVILALVARGSIRLAPDEDFIDLALVLSLSLGHKLPDCVYLALAEHAGAGLATADRRLGTLAESRGVRTILVPSA